MKNNMQRSISQYLELIFYMAYSRLRVESSRNYLSFAWWVIEPVLSMMVYYLVFGVLFERRTEDFVPFLLIGLITWQWFGNTVQHSIASIVGGGKLISQVWLPKVILPGTVIAIDVIKFAFSFLMLLLFLWIYGFDISIHYLGLVPLFAVQLLLISVFSCLVAGFYPFLPDSRYIVTVTLHLGFFFSGVLFPGDAIPLEYRDIFYLNPMAVLIEGYRDVLMYQAWPDCGQLAMILIFACIGMILAFRFIARFEYIYPRMSL